MSEFITPRPATVFLFAPGAGAGSHHPWMQHWAKLLESLGAVELLDYPYMREGRGRPDPLPKLVAAHRAALDALAGRHPGLRLVLVGKSMGGRVGCHVALEDQRVANVICFGYPLCGGGDPTKLRDKVLKELRTPILFLQGTRDALCPQELLEPVRHQMTAPHRLHLVPEGDHSLLVTKTWLKKNGQSQETVDAAMLAAIRSFLQNLQTEA